MAGERRPYRYNCGTAHRAIATVAYEPDSGDPRRRNRRFHSHLAGAQGVAGSQASRAYRDSWLQAHCGACGKSVLCASSALDRIWAARCGVENLLCGPPKIVENAGHAARQLARPIEEMGIRVVDLSEKVFPSTEDRQFASDFLRSLQQPIIAIHPGSGSKEKNCPLENWIALFSRTGGFPDAEGKQGGHGKFPSLVVISGEADKSQTEQLESEWKDRDVRFAKNLPLPQLAAVLERSIFIGHDSGISHLAAAAGANCILLFGPTNPNVWAPRNKNVRVLVAPSGRLSVLEITRVEAAITAALCDWSVEAGSES